MYLPFLFFSSSFLPIPLPTFPSLPPSSLLPFPSPFLPSPLRPPLRPRKDGFAGCHKHTGVICIQWVRLVASSAGVGDARSCVQTGEESGGECAASHGASLATPSHEAVGPCSPRYLRKEGVPRRFQPLLSHHCAAAPSLSCQ